MVTAEAPNRRASDRFRLHPAYTRVAVTPAARPVSGATELGVGAPMEGHAYNISLTGLRFELDEALPPGLEVLLELFIAGDPQTIRLRGTVVRIFDAEDDPGPRRMAVHFSTFESEAEREHLVRRIAERFFGTPER